MLKRFVVAASLVFVTSCASFHSYSFATAFDAQLKIREANETVPQGVTDFGGDTLFDRDLPKLVKIADDIHYKVKFAGILQTSDGEQLYGYTDKDEKVIYLSMDQSPDMFIHTFIHELSHAMQPMPMSFEGQVFAETVAAIVTSNLGVQSTDSAFAYISQFQGHNEAIVKWTTEIDKLAKFFLERLK